MLFMMLPLRHTRGFRRHAAAAAMLMLPPQPLLC